ncbi:MAG: InlB B-repeat-containing protein [Candidatus Omnitrophica bacterium]|nr:InlB B-repeat-containing protein [Candidatus Omnitrophota bacterium]
MTSITKKTFYLPLAILICLAAGYVYAEEFVGSSTNINIFLRPNQRLTISRYTKNNQHHQNTLTIQAGTNTITDPLPPYSLSGDSSSGTSVYIYDAIGTNGRAQIYNQTSSGTNPETKTIYFEDGAVIDGNDLVVTIEIYPPPTYTLTTSVSPSAGGSISWSPQAASYTSGDRVSLTASPANGYNFTGWSGDVSGTSNPISVYMNYNKTVTANFALRTYTLTTFVYPSGVGAVTPSGTNTYTAGSTVTLTATAQDTRYRFKFWNGYSNSTQNPLSITMDRSREIEARFDRFYTLTISVNPEDKGTVAKSPDKPWYWDRETVQLIPVPASGSGYIFKNWSGDLSGQAAPIAITMDSSKNIIANFSPSYTLNLTDNLNDPNKVVVSKHPDKSIYVEGERVYITFNIVDSGYVFTGWSGDLVSRQNSEYVVMDRDKTIQGNFVLQPRYSVNVTITPTSAGYVRKLPDQPLYAKGQSVELEAVAHTGYQFVKWTGDLYGKSNPVKIETYANRNITARFERLKHRLTLSPTGVDTIQGKVSSEPAGPIHEYGSTVVVSAVPNEDYEFYSWKGDVSESEQRSPRVNVLMDRDKKLTALFKPKKESVELYVIQNDADSFVIPDKNLNYPEVIFLIPVAVQRQPDGNLTIYKPTSAPDKPVSFILNIPQMYIEKMKIVIEKLSGVTLTSLSNLIADNTPPYEISLFKAGVTGLKDEMERIKQRLISGLANNPAEETRFEVSQKGYDVYAIIYWSCEQGTTLPLKIKKDPSSSIVNKVSSYGHYTASINQFSFVRHNIERSSKEENKFQGNPGKLVVKEIDKNRAEDERTYTLDNIIRFKAETANSNTKPQDNKVPDWLEVAVADIYNNPADEVEREVFAHVWHIDVKPIPIQYSAMYIERTRTVIFKASDTLYNLTRFNKSNNNINIYGFVFRQWRDGLIRHEAFHGYHSVLNFSPNYPRLKNVFDNDCDMTYVSRNPVGVLPPNEVLNPLLTFSYDHKSRGFLNRRSIKTNYYNAQELLQWYNNKFTIGSGDFAHKCPLAYFVIPLPLTAGQIDQLCDGILDIEVSLPGLPSDFPILHPELHSLVHLSIMDVVLYKPASDRRNEFYFSLNQHKLCAIKSTSIKSAEGAYGYYYRGEHTLKISGNGRLPILASYRNELKNGTIKIYLCLAIHIIPDPYEYEFYEYDASYFAIGLRR